MTQADRTIKGTIFNIQKYSVNDGPGIRTVVFFKGCPLRCRWCSNPESQLAKPQVIWHESKCMHCSHCVEICPKHAVSQDAGEIIIDHAYCVSCGKCIRECPGRALEIEGETKSVQEVLDVVLQDKVFYEESGGGITLSGGEMLVQPAFAAQLLKAAKEEGLNTCAETTGYADPEVFAGLIEYLDVILMDLKHWDPEAHRIGTGVTNKLPIANMKQAIQAGKEVLPRIPVIPDFNNSLIDAEKMAKCLKEIGASKCQLLPFHQFGENKYSQLGKAYAYQDIPALHPEDLQEYKETFVKNGIEAYF